MPNVLATTTMVKSMGELRAHLALATAEQAAEHNYPLIVVDGSLCPEFQEELRQRGALVFQEEASGMGPSRRQAIRIGLDSIGTDGAVCFLEPEKGPLVRHLKRCFAHLRTASLVVPGRSYGSLRSYPRTQQLSEALGNHAFKLAIGRADLDMFFGARIFDARVGELFLKSRPSIPAADSWGTTHYPVIEAISLGFKVVGVELDYVHPPEQAVAEEGPAFCVKRIAQLEGLTRGTFLYATQLGIMRTS